MTSEYKDTSCYKFAPFFFNQDEQCLTGIPVAQMAPAAIGTTIMPTPVSDNITDVEIVPNL